MQRWRKRRIGFSWSTLIFKNRRIQTIFGEAQSINDFANGRNSLDVVTTKDVLQLHEEVDRAYLFNVLQIVPIHSIRREILRRLFKVLRPGGQIIVSVQYRNSDFKRMAEMKNARRFRDGIIINHLRGTSFYGFIKPSVLERMIGETGFAISRRKLDDGSCYVWATKPV